MLGISVGYPKGADTGGGWRMPNAVARFGAGTPGIGLSGCDSLVIAPLDNGGARPVLVACDQVGPVPGGGANPDESVGAIVRFFASDLLKVKSAL
jgi:hypothetical protein